MKRKHRRLLLLLFGLASLATATVLALLAFQDTLVFFYSPSELAEKKPGPERLVRVGGLVEAGSLRRGSDGRVEFVVTDLSTSLPVSYRGLLPDLFREGQGVVVQGRLHAGGRFEAVEVLAKHDETYMPPEVAEALRASGHWQPESGSPPAGAKP